MTFQVSLRFGSNETEPTFVIEVSHDGELHRFKSQFSMSDALGKMRVFMAEKWRQEN